MNELTENDLKQCPFCGEKPVVYYCNALIECPRCSASIHGDSIKDLFDRWNTRDICFVTKQW